jgi:hypothetical protein
MLKERKLCKGPKDPNYLACRHEWVGYKEKGAKDNEIYNLCAYCELICPVPKGGAYPPECIKHQMERVLSKMDKTVKKNETCTKCGLPPDLCACKEIEKERKLVNAKDFRDSKAEGCVECEQD